MVATTSLLVGQNSTLYYGHVLTGILSENFYMCVIVILDMLQCWAIHCNVSLADEVNLHLIVVDVGHSISIEHVQVQTYTGVLSCYFSSLSLTITKWSFHKCCHKQLSKCYTGLLINIVLCRSESSLCK